MTVKQSYDLYREQYQRHLDELSTFMSGLSWDVDKLMLNVKADIITIRRTDTGKRLRLHYKQVLGLLRYVGKRIQELQGEAT